MKLKIHGGSPSSWVTPSLQELHTQIAQKAKHKHGAETKSSDKKTKSKAKRVDPVVNLTPDTLEIAAGAFQDVDGAKLDCIPFQQVKSDARGVAICTIEEAITLAKEPQKLSVDALALVTIGMLPNNVTWSVDVESLQWPAIYAPTGDPILVAGSLIQLGDHDVYFAKMDNPPEVGQVATAILRLQLWKDQTDLNWDDFKRGPVRMLLQTLPSRRFCDGVLCKGQCACFHAPVDEEIDHVLIDCWAWRWLEEDGKVTTKDKSQVFSIYARVPLSAVRGILAESGWHGFYAEPRASEGQGTDISYAVIWLPKMALEAVQNLARRHDQILGLARIRNKLGARLLPKDEPLMLQTLFPDRSMIAKRSAQML